MFRKLLKHRPHRGGRIQSGAGLIGALLALMAVSAPLQAEDIDCPPNPGAETIDGNVIVVGNCELMDTVVIGNVLVYAGGTLSTRNAYIDGNIQAEDAGNLRVEDSLIGGSIQLDRLVGDSADILGSEVIGSIQLNDNLAALLVDDTLIGADLQAFANSGGVALTANTIDGNLQCKDNHPPPTGGFNAVGGNAEDQCATLATTNGSDGSGGSGGGSGGDSEQCDGFLGAVRVDGDLVVASACELAGTTVDGNVVLYAGGSLVANDIRVIGNVQADNAFEIDVTNSDIDGNVQFDELVGDAIVSNSEVGGSIQLNDNRNFLAISNNRVNADIQVFANRGGADITDNTVGGNLQCKDNDPAPTGDNNTVSGNAEDQCASLQPANDAGQGGGTSNSNSASGSGNGQAANGVSETGGGGAFSGLLVVLLTLLATSRCSRRRFSHR